MVISFLSDIIAIQIGVSLGIGLNTLHGVLDKSHPLQIGRDETINIINKKFYNYRYEDLSFEDILEIYESFNFFSS